MMGMLRFVFFVLRYGLYMVLSLMFRVYLLLIFLTKDGASWILAVVTGAGGWFASGSTIPFLNESIEATDRLLGARLSTFAADHLLVLIHSELISPYRFEIAIGLVVIAVFIAARWSGYLLRPVLSAFPLPSRPLPPVWVRMPRPHKITAVRCWAAVPRLPQRFSNGDYTALVARLNAEVRRLITQKTPATVSAGASFPAPTVLPATLSPAQGSP